ncbi:MAG: Holliday junction resolvase RuvX, partial [Pseudomonadota bacterium]|nr:Holliday junction resolvase RuvX [Pseudomonadota bacterium]
FADRLAEKFRLPILWVDERYTSAQAEAYLKDTLFMRADKRKKVLDAHAAVRVLERALQILE